MRPVWFWILSMTVAFMLSFSLYWYTRFCYSAHLIEKQKSQISILVDSTLNDLMLKKMLLPQSISVSISDSSNKMLNNQIANEIAIYFKNKHFQKQGYSVVPNFTFPDKATINQSYTLTEQQVSELKNHLLYLTEKVENSIEKAKDEVNGDIQKINNWITIWIGVIGFLGIFIPLVTNYLSTKDIDKKIDRASINAQRAINKSSKATSEITQLQADLTIKSKEISRINSDVEQTKQTIKTFQDLAALERAVQISNRFYLLQSEKRQFVKITFVNIEKSFINYKDLGLFEKDNGTLKSILDNFYYSIIQLVIISKDREIYSPLSVFSEELKAIIDIELDKKSLDLMISSLNKLNSSLSV